MVNRYPQSSALTSGRIHSYESFGTLDGPGVRFVVFLQGCPLRCQYCHNPDTWDPKGGRRITAEEVIGKAERCRAYLRNGGVTLSGGEPLLQPEFAKELLQLSREAHLHTALDTAGTAPLSIAAPVADAADMVLLDIKSIDPETNRILSGQTNANALALLKHCESTGKRTWIRHVIIPGITLDMKKLEQLAAFLKPYSCVEKVELLPFHQLGAFKWQALNMPYPLAGVPEPTASEIKAANDIFLTGR